MGVVGTRHKLLEAGIAGGVTAFKQTEMAEHEGCGTDGAYASALCCLCLQRSAHAFMVAQVGCSWQTAGEQKHVGIAEVGILNREVCLYGYAVRGLHILAACYAHCLDVYTAATQNVDGCQAFHFLEAVG